MKICSLAATAIPGLLLTPLLAQSGDTAANPQRSFAIVQGSSMQMSQGEWSGITPLARYIHDHPGSYLVFWQEGAVYRLDSPEGLAEVQKLYAPLQDLAEKQRGLARAQKSLAGQQRTLATQEQPLARKQQDLAARQANSDAGDQTRLGQEQAALGQHESILGAAQSEIGRHESDLGTLEGALGRKEGELARAAYQRTQTIFDNCLADRTCRRVS